jgi:peroxiredoxin
LREKLETIQGANTELLAVDPHETWAAKSLLKDTGLSTDDLQFPLLMDPAQTVSATYGVAFQMRIHVEASNRPATFIIDKSGVLRYARRAKTFSDRPTPAQVVRELTKLDGK